VDDKCLQQVQNFKYLGCEISYEIGKDSEQKLEKFALTLGIVNNNFKQNLDQKFSGIKNIKSSGYPQSFIRKRNWAFHKGIKND
jgi:hypothetical protein